MFFVVSKIYWILASPIRLLLIVAIVGAVLSARRHARAGLALALTALALLAAAATTPLGVLLVAPLEDRFPEPPADLAAPDGIIVLGSAVNDEISSARGQTVLRRGRPRRRKRRFWRSATRPRGWSIRAEAAR